MKILVVVVCVLSVGLTEVQYQHPEEWQLWKTEHGKSYESQREELERHLVWLSNREYINAHNKNSDVFGFTLSMNHLGDIVSQNEKVSVKFSVSVDCRQTQSMRRCWPIRVCVGWTMATTPNSSTLQSTLLTCQTQSTGGPRVQSPTSRTKSVWN